MRSGTLDDIRIRLLGPVDLSVGDGDLGGRKRRLLLGVLALRVGTVTSTDVLIDTLWPDRLPEDAQRSLQVHVSRLRRVLLAAGIEASIAHSGGGYVLEADRGLVDVNWFEDLIEDGVEIADEDPGRASDTLRQALSLWRGRPLGGLADDSQLHSEVIRLDGLRLRGLQARIGADLATGHHDSLTAELQQLTDEHPFQERLWGHLVLALYRAGRQGEALATYERARSVLAEELGVDPSRTLQELHRQILRQDAALDMPGSEGSSPDDTASEMVSDPAVVAVLPFEVFGGFSDAAILASGLHTDLLTELSSIAELTVISRASVLHYRDTPAPQIARELRVGTIVTGAVQSAGRRFRLTVQLIDGPTGTQRWAESYDDELTTENIFAVQADLAHDIATSLSTELSPTVSRGVQPPTGELDAYRLVAAGRQQFDLKTNEGLARAVDCYQEAVRLDPEYASAWVGLCDSLVSMEAYGHGDRHQLLPRAEKAVHRALALDTDSAEARTSLGILSSAYQDGPAALREFERARRARPSYADAHNWHSWLSLLTGDARAGLASARRAADLDPRSAEAHAHVSLALAATGDARSGLSEARTARRLSPYSTADLYEALCLHELGRFAEARTVLEPLVERRGQVEVPWTECGPHALLALTLTALGDTESACAVAASVEARAFPFATGLIHMGLGALEEASIAFDRIERMTAWPCLVVHHYHRELWRSDGAATLHRRLVELALRSWEMGRPER